MSVMGTDSMIARAEIRHRWGSLLGVAVLVALVTMAVLTALVGAHRSSSAVDRFRSWSGASDLEYQSDVVDGAVAMLAAAQEQRDVEQATLRQLVNIWPTDGSDDLAVLSDPTGAYGSTIDRPLVLEGRMPATDAPDEVLLNELAATVTGLGVGDHIEANTWSEDDLDALFVGSEFPGFNGPQLDLTVVGIGRTTDGLSGSVRRTSPYAIGSPAFLTANAGIGAWPPAVMIRLHDGAGTQDLDEAISAVQFSQRSDTSPGGFHSASTTAEDVYLDTANIATDSLVVGLVLFAVAAALAGGLAVGQAVQRQLAGSVTPTTTLAALGLTRPEIARMRSLPIVLFAVAGIVVGVAGAVAASSLLPIGLVRRAEIDPGVWVDPIVLVVGGVAALALVWGWALLVAGRQAGRGARSDSTRRTPLAARLATRAGATPSVATGLRLAGDRGRGPGAVPVRSALVGVAIAVAGLVAAGVIASSYHELSGTPAYWGVPWQTNPDYFGDASVDEVVTAMSGDDRLQSIALYGTASMIIDDEMISVTSLEPVRGDMALTTLEGRLPATPTEIAFGTRTLAQLGLSIGDTTSTIPTGGGASVPLTVVGTAVLPATEEYSVGVGAVVTGEGMARFAQGDFSYNPVLDFAPDADVATVQADLSDDYGLDFNLFTEPRPQGEVANLAEPGEIAAALAGFLLLLGVVGLVHVLMVSIRRRRRDLGVLRALGLRGRQAEWAVIVEALALTAGGLVIGLPVGAIVGRAVWSALVADLGAVADAQWPWWLLLALLPAAAVLAVALSWWPAHRVRVASPAVSLRSE